LRPWKRDKAEEHQRGSQQTSFRATLSAVDPANSYE